MGERKERKKKQNWGGAKKELPEALLFTGNWMVPLSLLEIL